MTDFTHWAPMRIFWRDAQPMVDWGFLGTRRFTDPFFGQTIHQCVTHPADLLFRHQTPLATLGEIVGAQPSLRPAGFIFHLSRCGSTLVTQMLAAAPENLVLSEPDPVDTILRSHFRDPAITEAQRRQWLQWLVGALGWRRHAEEQHLFVKFDCWHARFLPLIERAFPGVPWIFVYREPIEVLVSHQGQRGAQMIPGVLEPALFGWDAAMVGRMSLEEYGARVLAAIGETALARVRAGAGKLVNYSQLPELLWQVVHEHWQVPLPSAACARMQAAAARHAKNPALAFAADSKAKQRAATPELRAVADQWLAGVYHQLEQQRQVAGFA